MIFKKDVKIMFDCNKCNIINLMIVVGMFKMNCMINGLVIVFEKWYVAQFVV